MRRGMDRYLHRDPIVRQLALAADAKVKPNETLAVIRATNGEGRVVFKTVTYNDDEGTLFLPADYTDPVCIHWVSGPMTRED